MSRFKPSMDWLLVFVPVALVMHFVPSLGNDTAVFICACLAIVPLAGWMGKATEELTAHMGEGWGGFLNATFGNAAELIIALMALSKGLTGVVKASITGSIIGNILLVLGVSIFGGGLRYPRQKFNQTAARASTTSLTVATIALLTPTIFHYMSDKGPGGWSPATEQKLSLAIAIVLILLYFCILAFSLKTHRELYVSGVPDEPGTHVHTWSRGKSIGVLFVATAFVALMSEFLVGTVEAARVRFGFSEIFVGVIVVAIIGNAAEHSTAVAMALKNRMDLSLGIAVGSSLQIALFVAPVLVFASYFFKQQMNLEFTIPEIVAVGFSVHLLGQISGDGESNWLEGVQLLGVYLILGILFYFLPSH